MLIAGCIIAAAFCTTAIISSRKTADERINELFSLMRMAYNRGDFGLMAGLEFEAGHLIEKGYGNNPDIISSICFGLSSRFSKAGNNGRAVYWLEKSLAATPETHYKPRIYDYMALGSIAFDMKDYGAAEKHFSKTLELIALLGNENSIPKDKISYYKPLAYYYLGEIENTRKQYSEAVRYFKSAINAAEQVHDGEIKDALMLKFFISRGISHELLKDDHSAEGDYLAALKYLEQQEANDSINRKAPEIYYRLSHLYYERGRFADALFYLEKASGSYEKRDSDTKEEWGEKISALQTRLKQNKSFLLEKNR